MYLSQNPRQQTSMRMCLGFELNPPLRFVIVNSTKWAILNLFFSSNDEILNQEMFTNSLLYQIVVKNEPLNLKFSARAMQMYLMLDWVYWHWKSLSNEPVRQSFRVNSKFFPSNFDLDTSGTLNFRNISCWILRSFFNFWLPNFSQNVMKCSFDSHKRIVTLERFFP